MASQFDGEQINFHTLVDAIGNIVDEVKSNVYTCADDDLPVGYVAHVILDGKEFMVSVLPTDM